MEGKKTVAFHTLGCKLNYSETSAISKLMEVEGFEKRKSGNAFLGVRYHPDALDVDFFCDPRLKLFQGLLGYLHKPRISLIETPEHQAPQRQDNAQKAPEIIVRRPALSQRC